MISVDEMNAIRFIREGGKVRTIRDRYNPKFPLRRLIYCPDCSRPLTGSTSRGRSKKYDYYHCYNTACPRRWIMVPKAQVEEAFAVLLERITPTEEFLKYFGEVALDKWARERDTYASNASEYESELQGLEERRKAIFNMREDGTYTTEEFKERMAEVNNKIATTRISTSESRMDQYDMEAGIEYAKQAIRDIQKQWLNLSPTLRGRFQKLVFPQGITYDKKTGFGTVVLGRIFSLNRDYALQKSPLVDLRGVGPRPRPCHGRVLPLNYRPSLGYSIP